MNELVPIFPRDCEPVGVSGYFQDIKQCFTDIPDVAKPLICNAERILKKIEKMLCTAPAFVSVVKALIPKEAYQAIFTDEQKAMIANGALKLMTKKDGSLMANLINTKTKKIASTVSLDKVKLSPELAQVTTNYIIQMQMAQIAEQIQAVQAAIEEVRQGQESDRLATAYSCRQKLLQAMAIHNSRLKEMALMQIAFDAEDSRNLLMQSQSANALFIQNQPESFWGKLVHGAASDKLDARMRELQESLFAVNMVSLAEAIAYQEMGEIEAAKISLQYYARYIQNTYLRPKGFVKRLDMLDPSPKKYWSEILPAIKKEIYALSSVDRTMLLKGEKDGTETL